MFMAYGVFGCESRPFRLGSEIRGGCKQLRWDLQARTDATNLMEISQRKSKLSAVAKDIDLAFSSSLDKIAGETSHLAPGL